MMTWSCHTVFEAGLAFTFNRHPRTDFYQTMKKAINPPVILTLPHMTIIILNQSIGLEKRVQTLRPSTH